MCCDGYWLFFFQAEDGIRDLVRSRGLGDVYKRQVHAGGEVVVVRGDQRREARLAHQRFQRFEHVDGLSLIHI